MKVFKKFQFLLIFSAIGMGFSLPLHAEDHGSADDRILPVRHPSKSPDNPHQFTYLGHDIERGKAIPEDFRGRDYRIEDWQDKGLPPPPDRQYWA